MHSLSVRFSLLALLLPGFLTGCGGGARIEGTVNFDGQPVDGGTITFIPTAGSGKGTNAGGQIIGGKYSIDAPGLSPGSKSPAGLS